MKSRRPNLWRGFITRSQNGTEVLGGTRGDGGEHGLQGVRHPGPACLEEHLGDVGNALPLRTWDSIASIHARRSRRSEALGFARPWLMAICLRSDHLAPRMGDALAPRNGFPGGV